MRNTANQKILSAMRNPVLNPLNAILDTVENGDQLTVERFAEDVGRNRDLIDCLKIHLKYEQFKVDAEQEHLEDFLTQWQESDHPATDEAPEAKHINQLLRTFSIIQRMDEMPEGQGLGYFKECDQDRSRELERYHRATQGQTFAARIAQAKIDKPNYRRSFNELQATYAEQNVEACQSLLSLVSAYV